MPALALSKESILGSIPEIEAIDEPRVGGQKAVYKIRVQNADYALKVIVADSSEASNDASESVSFPDVEETIARVRREIQILKGCNIPQLARIGPLPFSNKVIDGHDVYYYTEDWIDGRSLDNVIRDRGLLSLNAALNLGTDIAKAIEALWSCSKIHRDIKPSNIIERTSDHHYVLLDLGIALDLRDVSLTKTGYFPGSFPYYSPEQTYPASKRQMDFRSDLFNLGIVLFEALTGQNPFLARNSNFDLTVDNIRTKIPLSASSLRSEVPSELDMLINRLLEKKPHMRYKSCEQLCGELAAIRAKVKEVKQ